MVQCCITAEKNRPGCQQPTGSKRQPEREYQNRGGESRTGPQVRSGVWGQGWGMKKQTARRLSYSYCPYREILVENGQEVVEETKPSG